MTALRRLRVELRVAADPFGNWPLALADQLQRDGHIVGVASVPGASAQASLQLLKALEQTLFGLTEAPTPPAPPPREDADLVIDLAGAPAGHATHPTLTPTFDGLFGEAGAASVLLERRAPRIDILFLDGGEGPRCVATGTPALEDRMVFTRSFETVGASAASLLRSVVRRIAAGEPFLREALVEGFPPPSSFAVQAAGAALSTLSHKIRGRLTRIAARGDHFKVGWRQVSRGDRNRPIAESLAWPEQPYAFLPDDGRRYFADPFVFAHEGRCFIFCEEFVYATGKGLLTAFELTPDGRILGGWPVLEQPWHLSYPHIFARDGEIWMIPETAAVRRIELYRAERFPDRWTREAILVDDIAAADATLTEHNGRLWLFATAARDGLSDWSALHLFHAERLFGPWTAHPGNPTLIDAGAARPAGATFVREGVLWRPTQDCSQCYGGGLTFCRVERLDEMEFRQTPQVFLTPPTSWRAQGAHTVNCAAGIEVIDVFGSILRRYDVRAALHGAAARSSPDANLDFETNR